MMMGHGISWLIEDTLHIDKYTFDSKLQQLRMRYPFQSTGRRFHTETVVVSRLHDTVVKFRTGVKFSLQYNNRGDLCRLDIL